jgi:hypothetical protein
VFQVTELTLGSRLSRLTASQLDGRAAEKAEFLRSQAQGTLALDFFTADLLNGTKVHVLAVIEYGTRRIRVLGATENPVQSWVVQQARNLLMDPEDAGTLALALGAHVRGPAFRFLRHAYVFGQSVGGGLGSLGVRVEGSIRVEG